MRKREKKERNKKNFSQCQKSDRRDLFINQKGGGKKKKGERRGVMLFICLLAKRKGETSGRRGT